MHSSITSQVSDTSHLSDELLCVGKAMEPTKTYPCAMTIAGSDSSGGAGIQADLKAMSATGSYAASVITALTAQNTQGVQGIYAVPPAFVAAQMEAVFSDIKIKAVKIGMLFNQDIIETVAALLKKYKVGHVIVDPVMVSKSGSELLEPEAIEALKKTLFGCATLITPNLSEAEKLIAQKITNLAEMEAAAVALSHQYKTNILMKGGHLKTQEATDLLYVYESACCHQYRAKRIETKNTHGTGCTLSSAIASFLAQDYSLPEAVTAAKTYLTQAIQVGSTFKLGQGYGPLAHFYQLENLAQR